MLYSSKRTAKYLRLETLVAEAISAAHGEVPDAKPQQVEVRILIQSISPLSPSTPPPSLPFPVFSTTYISTLGRGLH